MSHPEHDLFPRPQLFCDIGGTNIRFGARPGPTNGVALLKSAPIRDFPNFIDACRDAIALMHARPASLIVCAAGPTTGGRTKLTNFNWVIDGQELIDAIPLKQGLLLNDFEALAYTLPALAPTSLAALITPTAAIGLSETRVVLGPGTGLGVAALIAQGERLLVLPGEGGHMELAPFDAEDAETFPLIERPLGRLTAESVISGPGLERLHRARCRRARIDASVSLNAAEITAAALRAPGGFEAQSIRHFWRLTARFSGDIALAFGARGGVVLAGGVLPKIAPLFDAKEFHSCFTDKAPMASMMREIPVSLLLDDSAALQGLARIADAPDAYQIDFKTRCWRRNA